ncbi:MAG: hypothetical protein MZV70_22025 [Desulfobacterales bacterium]|nr:hypothetical protein [Desulfobacterales bacterium]
MLPDARVAEIISSFQDFASVLINSGRFPHVAQALRVDTHWNSQVNWFELIHPSMLKKVVQSAGNGRGGGA